MTLVSVCQSESKLHCVHPSNLKKEGLTGPQFLKGGDFYQRGGAIVT